jgi:hypothetical protein
MSYHLDEYDLEMSHERERRLDRDAEHEPRPRVRRLWKGRRYLTLGPAANVNDVPADKPFVSSPVRQTAMDAA